MSASSEYLGGPGETGFRPLTVYGKVVPFYDRPLVISTYRMWTPHLSDSLLRTAGYEIGFLDYAAINPDYLIQGGGHAEANEISSVNRTQCFLALLKASGEELAFNGRVIFISHGWEDSWLKDYVGAGFGNFWKGDTAGIIESGRKVGTRLSDFFREYDIKVTRLDLDVCCAGDNSRMSDAIFDALKDTIPTLEVTSVKGIPSFEKRYSWSRYQIKDPKAGKVYRTRTSDFYMKGQYPKAAIEQGLIARNVAGSPPLNYEPEDPDCARTGCCKNKYLVYSFCTG